MEITLMKFLLIELLAFSSETLEKSELIVFNLFWFDYNTGHKKKFFEIDGKKVTPLKGTEKVPLFITFI